MGNMYRILIESGDGETVADLTAPVEMLAQFAPEAVARLLREATPEAEGDTPAPPEAGNYGPGQPKRRRRTKAEMEAARAAEPSTPESPAIPDPGPAPMAMDGPAEVAAYNPFGPK